MIARIRKLLMASLILVAAVSYGDSLRLLPMKQTVIAGTRPHFTLNVTNHDAVPKRFIDVRKNRRSDLRDSYYRLIVVDHRGKKVGVPVAISDPGPISESDYFMLQPGQSADIDMPDSPLVLEKLRPGRYRAWVEYKHFEYPARSRENVKSSVAAFRVKSGSR